MLLGFLWGAFALVFVAIAMYLYVGRQNKDSAIMVAVFAAAMMGWGVWSTYHAGSGIPVSRFDLKTGETYEFTNGFAFENAFYGGVIGKDGEMRLYKLPGRPPHLFRVKRGDDNIMEFEDADPKHQKK